MYKRVFLTNNRYLSNAVMVRTLQTLLLVLSGGALLITGEVTTETPLLPPSLPPPLAPPPPPLPPGCAKSIVWTSDESQASTIANVVKYTILVSMVIYLVSATAFVLGAFILIVYALFLEKTPPKCANGSKTADEQNFLVKYLRCGRCLFICFAAIAELCWTPVVGFSPWKACSSAHSNPARSSECDKKLNNCDLLWSFSADIPTSCASAEHDCRTFLQEGDAVSTQILDIDKFYAFWGYSPLPYTIGPKLWFPFFYITLTTVLVFSAPCIWECALMLGRFLKMNCGPALQRRSGRSATAEASARTDPGAVFTHPVVNSMVSRVAKRLSLGSALSLPPENAGQLPDLQYLHLSTNDGDTSADDV